MSSSDQDAPVLFKLPGRNLPARIRGRYDAGRDVHLISKTSAPEALARVLGGLGSWRPAYWTSVETGAGWTLTIFAHQAITHAFTYWPSATPAPVWRWACRACGTVDYRFAWRDVDEATAPMVRYAIDFAEDELVAVPWCCPQSYCHGQPRWQYVLA